MYSESKYVQIKDISTLYKYQTETVEFRISFLLEGATYVLARSATVEFLKHYSVGQFATQVLFSYIIDNILECEDTFESLQDKVKACLSGDNKGYATGGLVSGANSSAPIQNEWASFAKKKINAVVTAAKRLPGIKTQVAFPCVCGTDDNKFGKAVTHKVMLYDMIIHLNDQCKWSRERIADWIDRLHDEGIINAEFEPWNEETNGHQD